MQGGSGNHSFMTTIPTEEGSCAMSSSGSNSKAHNGEEAEPKRDADEASNEGSTPTMSLTSDEVNYLIFRYLQESGFVHSSFTFVYESMLGRSNIRNAEKNIPPGALLSFLQKGLQYVAIEETLQSEGAKPRKSGMNDNLFSLLSPQTISSLMRENPPIQLNVPPATAAAAVKARLEAEAKIEADRKTASVKAANDHTLSNGMGAAQITGPSSIPPQPMLDSPNPLSLSARSALAAQAVAAQAAAAAAMSQLQQQGALSMPVPRQNIAETAGAAAALAAQERRVVAAEIAALQEQQQFQLHQQLQQQQQQLQLAQQQQRKQQLQQQQMMSQAEGITSAQLAASPLTSVSAQIGMKRPAGSAKKGPKSKGKSKRIPQAESLNLMAQPATGFASLEEAVARLEASNGVSEKVDSSNSLSTPMDLEENDQRGNPSSLPAHSDLGGIQVASQELMNGQRMDRNGQGLVMGIRRPLNGQQLMQNGPPKLSNGPFQPGRSAEETTVNTQADALIDREDEKTNAMPSEVLELKMHSSEVFMCAWNPVFTDMIATGSGDASARIWHMGGAKASAGLGPVRLLPHGTGPRDRKNKDVTTLEWSSDGNLLATGSYDGVARVWSRTGGLVHTLRGHKGPIFSLKWNKRGNYLLSGSYDKTTIVWDVSGSTGFVEQQFNDHQAPALDVDWKDDVTFASCSTDKTVHICRVGMPRPLKTYTGHTDEVNAVKWDPSGTLLASCSDDCTAKVWDVGSDRKDPMQDFKSHQQEIYTVKWSPTGPGSRNPTKRPMLATASFDGSVRLWNVQDGSCIQVFSRHRDSVYSVAFSPSGNYLASGSLAGQLYIWNVKEGRHIKSFKGKGDIFEVAWNKEETRVAACFSSNVVSIIDFQEW